MITLADIDTLTGGKLGRFNTSCPLCSPLRRPKNQRAKVFAIWRDEPGFASFNCIHCGAHGFVRDQHAPRIDHTKLTRERHKREARELANLREKMRHCERLWCESVPLPPEAIIYFAKRNIDIGQVPDHGGLRWHPAMPSWIGGPTCPSIIARFTDPIAGTPGGIWHRSLTGGKPKALGPMKGGVIRLWPDEAVTISLAIGEGIETMMAAALHVTYRGTLLQPAWACTCRTNLRDFPILPSIEHLTICADNDDSGDGQGDARECAMRWVTAGREAEVFIADEIGDFNDLVIRRAR